MLVSGNININFDANTNVAHRLCYRMVGSSGPYTCVNTSICGIGPCSGSIPVLVDPETCAVLQYEGYVQAGCQDISSGVDRVAFTASFTPTPGCLSYTVSCTNVPISPNIVITNGGSGGYVGATPSVIFTGGGGSGAVGSAVIGLGGLNTGSQVLTVAGSGYTNGTYTGVNIIGGTGSGAAATVVVSGGMIFSIAITSRGTGYAYNEPELSLNAASLGGSSPTVSANFTATSNLGDVIAITISNQGTGYTSAPTVTISSFGGHQATATASLMSCSSFTNNGCLGSSVIIPQGVLNVGDTMSVCSNTGVVTPGSNYSVALAGNCLCSCVSATITATGPATKQIRYFYTRCNNVVVTGVLTVGSSPAAIVDCIVPNSLKFQTIDAGVTGTVSYGGAC